MTLSEALIKMKKNDKLLLSKHSWKDGEYVRYIPEQVISFDEINPTIGYYIKRNMFNNLDLKSYTIESYTEFISPSTGTITYNHPLLALMMDEDDFYFLNKEEK